MHLHMEWGGKYQLMKCDDQEFRHEGPINTACVHDLAHLLIAASSQPEQPLAWKPSGSFLQINLSEYHAVLVEHFLIYCARAAFDLNLAGGVIKAISDHMRKFTTEDWKTFPIPSEFVMSQFFKHLDPARFLNLSPLFFNIWLVERNSRFDKDPDALFTLDFDDSDAPPVTPDNRLFVGIVDSHLRKLSTWGRGEWG